MKVIVAQGNPGATYARTRHNTGFMVLDAYAKTHDLTWLKGKHFPAEIAEFKQGNEKVLLVKPHSFYNETRPSRSRYY